MASYNEMGPSDFDRPISIWVSRGDLVARVIDGHQELRAIDEKLGSIDSASSTYELMRKKVAKTLLHTLRLSVLLDSADPLPDSSWWYATEAMALHEAGDDFYPEEDSFKVKVIPVFKPSEGDRAGINANG